MTFRRVLLVAALVLLTSDVSIAQLDSLQTSTKDEQMVSGMVLIPSGHFWMGRARLYLGEGTVANQSHHLYTAQKKQYLRSRINPIQT